MNFAKKQKTAK